MKRIFTLICSCLIASLVSSSAAPEAGSLAEENTNLSWAFTPDPDLPNVLLLGDSISIGYTLQVRELLQGKANVYRPTAPNGKRALNCSGSDTGVAKLENWLGDTQWSVIHFNWGLHDLKHVIEAGKHSKSNDPNGPTLNTIEQYQQNLAAIVAKLKATEARLIFATTTPVVPGTLNPLRTPDAPSRYNAGALEIMQANNIRVNDLYAFTEPHLNAWQLPKNVHFNPAGSAALAQQVASVITEELALADAQIPSAKPRKSRTAKRESKYLETTGERKLDLVYKQVDQRELLLDLYYPTANRRDKLPIIIYTHGGGWAAGSRANAAKGLFVPLFSQLLDAGFAVASVDYRLYNKRGTVAMRDCVIDSKDAVRYLTKHAESLGLDTQQMYMMGDSAGGQIAQMLLLSPPDTLVGDPDLADVDYQLQGGVSWYGPCDFEDQNLFNYDDRPNFVDRFGPRIVTSKVSPKGKLMLYREMSPINYLRQDSPPLLMIQGDKDTTIPVKHAYYMQQRAQQLRAPVDVVIVKNAGHNWRKVGADIEPSYDEIVERTVRFYTELNSRNN